MLLAAGIHCIIEKPIALDGDSATAVVKAEKESTARVMIGHHRRFLAVSYYMSARSGWRSIQHNAWQT